ncbi:mitochondrial carrier domain-containing protein [Chytridium lagenaria]|nr:mitochondrial carrier domain-containing protein [Chytridium lagenaria]
MFENFERDFFFNKSNVTQTLMQVSLLSLFRFCRPNNTPASQGMADSVTGGGPAKNFIAIPALYPRKAGKPRAIGSIEKFAISALSPAVAVIFTNPFDTAKVRLQLQGQRLKQSQLQGKPEPLVYKNTFDTLYKISRNEGLGGLQKGLTPAILREGSKNLFRIGMYDPIMSIMHDSSRGSAPGWKRMIAGSLCGVMGAFSCNPFELVKTRLQSAAAKGQAVGHQHQYKGVVDALRQIVRQDGVKGLYRGSVLSMGRSIVGSGTNLSSFSMMKEYLIVKQSWKDNWVLDMVAGLGSGVISCIAMNPIDVVRTRYYNQPYENGKGVIYSSGGDAIYKIVKTEGFGAFYKGFFTHFLRIGPHFCFTFVFLGMFRRQLNTTYDYLDRSDSFKSFDKDGNGYLDRVEVEDAMKSIIPKSIVSPEHLPYYESMIDTSTRRILTKADRDGDGRISFSEYIAMVDEVKSIFLESHSRPFLPSL